MEYLCLAPLQYDEVKGNEAFAEDFQQAMTYYTKQSLVAGEVDLQDAYDWRSAKVSQSITPTSQYAPRINILVTSIDDLERSQSIYQAVPIDNTVHLAFDNRHTFVFRSFCICYVRSSVIAGHHHSSHVRAVNVQVIMDVGGGRGELLARCMLYAGHESKGVLFDRQWVLDRCDILL